MEGDEYEEDYEEEDYGEENDFYGDDSAPVDDGLVERCIGEYSGVTNTLHLEKCDDIKWVRNRPPKDRTFQRIVETRVNTTLYIIIVVVASIGILLALVFLAINIKFRNERLGQTLH